MNKLELDFMNMPYSNLQSHSIITHTFSLKSAKLCQIPTDQTTQVPPGHPWWECKYATT